MSSALPDIPAAHLRYVRAGSLPAATLRPGFVVIALLAAVAGFVATSQPEARAVISGAGPELTQLLRAMAVMKALFAAAVVSATVWRLGSAVTLPRLICYVAACAAMSAGPGLIWDMAHVKAGALLLHGGLFATIVMLWRDPAMSERLARVVAGPKNVWSLSPRQH